MLTHHTCAPTRPSHSGLFSGTALNGVIFTGIYSDMTPNWYRDVARPLIISGDTGCEACRSVSARWFTAAQRDLVNFFLMRSVSFYNRPTVRDVRIFLFSSHGCRVLLQVADPVLRRQQSI